MEGVAGATVLKAGMLSKLGDKVHNWKKRHFVLHYDNHQLQFAYYKTPDSDEPLGSFRINDASCFRVLNVPESPLKTPVMEVITPKRAYQMAAEAELDLREWEWAIDKALSHLREQQLEREDGTSSASGNKSGLLMKKGGKRHNWKLRWFVLDDASICYYSSKPEKRKSPLGKILLEQCLMVTRLIERRADNRFTFTIETPGRTYHIATNGELEMHDWLRALERKGCPIAHASNRSNSVFFIRPPTLTKAGDELEAMSFDASGSESEEGILDEEGPRQGNTGAAGGPVAPPRSPRTRRKRPGLVPPATVMASFAAMHELFRPPNAVGASPLTSAPNA